MQQILVNCTRIRYGMQACWISNKWIICWWCKMFTTLTHNTIDYVTIASTGDATDFGDLTVANELCVVATSSN